MADGPILFVDIDGTLRPRGEGLGATSAGEAACALRLSRLNALGGIPGLRVVVTSTWRSDPATVGSLLARGLTLAFHHRWRTTLDEPPPGIPARGWQVDRWLAEAVIGTNYAIADDFDDFLSWQADRLVLVDPSEGLTDSDVEALAALLVPDPAPAPADNGVDIAVIGEAPAPRFDSRQRAEGVALASTVGGPYVVPPQIR